MFKNYIPEVAKMLGVEIGEEFNIINSDRNKVSAKAYKFTEMHLKNVFGGEVPLLLSRILMGDCTIEKIPWKPKENEKYWFVMVDKFVSCDTFSYFSDSDLAILSIGNCFRTKEDAEAGIEEVLAKFDEIRNGVLE